MTTKIANPKIRDRSLVVGLGLALLLTACRKDNSLALLEASYAGDSVRVERLLAEKGANPDIAVDGGVTALHAACVNRRKEVVRVLLDHGARYENRTRLGNTPLLVAASMNWPEGVELLLKRGANVNVTNTSGLTPLICASGELPSGIAVEMRRALKLRQGTELGVGVADFRKVVVDLIENGANVNSRDAAGATPLIHMIRVAGSGEVDYSNTITLLLRHGADPRIRDNQGQSAFDWAAHSEKSGVNGYLSSLLGQWKPDSPFSTNVPERHLQR